MQPSNQLAIEASFMSPPVKKVTAGNKYLRKIKLTLDSMDYQLNKECGLNNIRKFTF